MTTISAASAAIPLILVRPFLPESPTWQRQKQAGTLKRPSFGELFDRQYLTTTVVDRRRGILAPGDV